MAADYEIGEIIMTGFNSRCDIMGNFCDEYRDDVDWEDFIEFNDLGLPLAYFASQALCDVSDDGVKFINDTWDLFMGALELEDTGFSNLEEVFLAAGGDL